MRRIVITQLVLVLLVSVLGCQEPEPEPPAGKPASTAPSPSASKLLVLVIEDDPLATGLKLLRGEWQQLSGAELQLEQWSVNQLLDAEELAADLIVFPSRHLGTLVDREWLRPVRESVLQSDDLARDELYPTIRNEVLPYGGEVYALSLGDPPLMLAGWGEPLSEAHSTSISTWENFRFQLNPENSPLQYPRAVELLVRGADYDSRREQSSRLFDAETMQPRISSVPYVQALTEMVENVRLPADAQVQLAIAWPMASNEMSLDETWFASLPRAERVYDPIRERWEANDSERVTTFLGFAGRSVGVCKSTRNSASAFKLLKWLVRESVAIQLSPRSDATVWFRTSQASQGKKWLPEHPTSAETITRVSELLSSDRCFLLPRIPGIDGYLQLLESVVSRSIDGELAPKEALAEVEAQWNSLTDRQGRGRLRAAYRKHWGLE